MPILISCTERDASFFCGPIEKALFLDGHYLAYFPAIAFWCLDGYFLWQERLFRALYDHVRLLDENEIDFSMNVSEANVESVTWFDAFLSKTLFMFHGVILVAIIIVMFVAL